VDGHSEQGSVIWRIMRREDLPEIAGPVWENNLRFRARAPLELETEQGQASLTLKTSDAKGRESGMSRLDVSCEGRPASLWFLFDLLADVMRSRFPGLEPASLEEESFLLVAQTVLHPLLGNIGKQLGTTVTFEAFARQGGTIAQESESFPIDVLLPDGMMVSCFLICHDVEAERLLSAFSGAALVRTPFSGLHVPVAFRCGHARISVSELAGLEVGAGIILDGTTLTFQKIVAVMAERFAQGCTWQSVSPVLDGPLLLRAAGDLAHYTAEGALGDASDPDSGTAAISDVPIHLVFELGRTELPLAELETLNAGYVFELGKPLSQSVDVLANGRRIASGDLVRIGEGIGVRVTKVIR
jgi:type III secretion protein Q